MPVVRAKRLTARGRGPGHMKIEVTPLEHKLKLLRSSWKLTNNTHEINVFILFWISHAEHTAELNSWMIGEENGWQDTFKMASKAIIIIIRPIKWDHGWMPQVILVVYQAPFVVPIQAPFVVPSRPIWLSPSRPLWWSPSRPIWWSHPGPFGDLPPCPLVVPSRFPSWHKLFVKTW